MLCPLRPPVAPQKQPSGTANRATVADRADGANADFGLGVGAMQPRQVLAKSEGPRDHFLWSLVVLLYVAVVNLYLPQGGDDAGTAPPPSANDSTPPELEQRVAALEASLAAVKATCERQVVEATMGDSAKPRRMQMGGDDLHQAADVHAEPAYILKRNVTRLRRLAPPPPPCDATSLPSRTAAITAECCDEPTEDCTGGSPHTCNAGCAAIFLPFWDE
eukprot:COSAG06_NODE_466_length_15349_cov_53.328262_2_plen_219_part_00